MVASSLLGNPPTGDHATIAYYTAVTNNFNDKPGDLQISQGAFFLGYRSPANWYLSWNLSRPQYTWQRPVEEKSFFAVAHQRIVWDTVTWQSGCKSGSTCPGAIVPLEFFSKRGASFWAVLDGPRQTARCWNRATSLTAWINQKFNSTTVKPWYVGGSPFTTGPKYRPLVRRGHVVTITSTYSYHSGAHVEEIDTTDARTLLFTRSVLHVAATKGQSGYTISTAISLASLQPPHVVLCA